MLLLSFNVHAYLIRYLLVPLIACSFGCLLVFVVICMYTCALVCLHVKLCVRAFVCLFVCLLRAFSCFVVSLCLCL